MKPYKIFLGIAAIYGAIAAASCAEDKYYDLGGWSSNTVNFTATNLALDSTRHVPSSSRDWYNLDYDPKEYDFDFYIPNTFDGYGMQSRPYTARTDRSSELWTGGYNDIRVTFFPSPEEKEATFTMPDGSTFTATADRPTFIWTPDSTLGQQYRYYPSDTYIKAETNYKKGNDEYLNKGFVYLNVDPDMLFNRDDRKWYESSWAKGEDIRVDSYNMFMVENLTIASQDTCVSYNPRFPQTQASKYNVISIPYIGYGGIDHVMEFVNYCSYDFYACGNSDLLFTFCPKPGEKEMTLRLPDYQQVTLTADNPTYVWHVTTEDVYNYNYDRVYASSTYTFEGITYVCTSEARLISLADIYYDAENDVFRSEWDY